MMQHEYTPILDFWFRGITPRQWFGEGGPELDDMIRKRFGPLLEKARRGGFDTWATSPRGRLALIVLLDQFSRHIFRGTPDAYASDKKAQMLSHEGFEAGMDTQLTFAERHFFYMPLMHAEDTELQALSVRKFTALRGEAALILDFATGHRSIVKRFGRFPHRNAVFGRTSTPDEEAFLASGENRFSVPAPANRGK